MDRRLVKLHSQNGWRFSEADRICVQRVRQALRDYVCDQIAPNSDEYGVRAYLLPLCEKILDGTQPLPLRYADFGLAYRCAEGLLPAGFRMRHARFKVAAAGSHLERPNEALIDGDGWAYMDFEEPGDWPDKVQYP